MSTGDRVESDPDPFETDPSAADPSATDPSAAEQPANDRPAVSMSRTTPDRAVFTEQGNTDGWIATSLTVDLDR